MSVYSFEEIKYNTIEFEPGDVRPIIYYRVTGKAARIARRILARFNEHGYMAYMKSNVRDYILQLLKLFKVKYQPSKGHLIGFVVDDHDLFVLTDGLQMVRVESTEWINIKIP